jgi:ferredoxin--NADP+ reductase
MFEIIEKYKLADNIIRLDIFAPEIAKKRKPGQFLIIMPDENSERVPFTIMDSDLNTGAVSVIIQIVGTATHKINMKQKGEKFYAVVGPLGKPTHIEKKGTIVCIGGGVGVAVVYPIAKAMKKKGNKIISIIGARNKDYIILKNEMEKVSDEIYFTTDDGSYGKKGFVTNQLTELIDKKVKIDLVLTIGPAIMMYNIVKITKPKNIETTVSLNSIMVDGTGMCGSCRVEIEDKTKFVCVDGPEFDGSKVDFDNLMKRQKSFLKKEKCSLHKFLEKNK